MPRSTMIARAFAMVTFAAAICGCSPDDGEDKGEEEAPFSGDEAKDDSFGRPTEHGTLSFASPGAAALSNESRFHSWTFALSGDATLRLEIRSSDGLDTVMYLYRREPGGATWGPYLAKDDDGGRGKLSRIDVDTDAAEYRVKVKGFTLDEEGAFELAATCSGSGCDAPAPAVATLTCADVTLRSDVAIELSDDQGSEFRDCWDTEGLCWSIDQDGAEDFLAVLFDELWSGDRFLEDISSVGSDIFVETLGEGGVSQATVHRCP